MYTSSILHELWNYLYPLGITNMALNLLYPLKRWWPYFKKLDKPIDAQLTFFDGKRILGNSTTFPGIVVVCVLGFVYQFWFANHYGLLLALLTYIGHAVGSFIKRRLSIPDGRFLPIVDHGDYIILTGLISWTWNLAPHKIILISIPLILILHPIICIIGYMLHIKKSPL